MAKTAEYLSNKNSKSSIYLMEDLLIWEITTILTTNHYFFYSILKII